MAGEEKINLDAFLEEMVALVNERLKKQEMIIDGLRKDMNQLKGAMRSLDKGNGLKIDKSVLKVLKGK